MFIYTDNRVDEGQRPLKPDEVSTGRAFRLEFQFPNLWQNHISDGLRIFISFVPVDEEHTILYLRSYQKLNRLPVLRDLTNWLAMRFNLVIAHQDRRVVETQRPRKTALKMGENLIQGDGPIVAYRMRRNALLEPATKT
jgi:phenylpropionate dioxygenase-like ring-hydroxylating dioxygenase large terminal subunit